MVHIIDHAPRVFVVGASTPRPDGIRAYLVHREEMWNVFTEGNVASFPESLIEIAGRTCYHSWNNPRKSTTSEYVQESIVAHKHESVLEHVTVNLLVADVCRSVEMEMIRHRVGVAYSWESQRFTDKHLRFIIPPLYRNDVGLRYAFMKTCDMIEECYRSLIDRQEELPDLSKTMQRKRTKEAARSILGNAVGADGMITMNLRSARHMIQLRTNDSADQSIRETFFEIYKVLREEFPATFLDAVETSGFLNVPQVTFATGEK